MRSRETEVVQVHAETEEVRCDIEGCSTVARPPQSEFPDRASEQFQEALPNLEGWLEVRIRASPHASESSTKRESPHREEPLDEGPLDRETGSGAHLHVCPKHVEGAFETTDLLQENLTSVLQGYLARQGLDYSTQEDRATEECN
jgi:hypothetical protein